MVSQASAVKSGYGIVSPLKDENMQKSRRS